MAPSVFFGGATRTEMQKTEKNKCHQKSACTLTVEKFKSWLMDTHGKYNASDLQLSVAVSNYVLRNLTSK